MRRFFSIAICSLLAIVDAGATARWIRNSASPFLQWDGGPLATGTMVQVRKGFAWVAADGSSGGTYYFERSVSANGSVVNAFISYNDGVGSVWPNTLANFYAWENQFPNGEGPAEFRSSSDGGVTWSSWGETAEPDPTPTPTPTPPPDDEFEFEYTFGADLGGAVIQIKDAQGNVLGTWTVPVGGGTVSGAVTAPSLTDATWFVDGLELGLIDDVSIVPNQGFVRPSYEFSFDGSYSGGEWKIERTDGSVGAIGSVGSSASVGKVTIGQGDTATVWTRVPAGDGNGGAWIPTTVSLSSGQPVVHSFVNNPAAPAPSPFPTPAPVTSPVPVPNTPTNSTTSPTTITNVPAADTNVVSVGVGTVSLGSLDDGEDDVIATATSIRTVISNIVTDVATAQSNLTESVSVLNSLRLGGVSSNCQFSFGPHLSINLETSGLIRAGLSALVVGLGIIGAVQLVRSVVS